MTATGTRAAVNMGKGKLNTDLKRTKWVWRPKGTYLDHVSKDNGSFMLKKVEYVYPKKILLQGSTVVDSVALPYDWQQTYLSYYERLQWRLCGFWKLSQRSSTGKIKDYTGTQTASTTSPPLPPPHRTRIPVKDVVQVAQEKPSENASPDKDIQDSEDAADKEEQHQMQDNKKITRMNLNIQAFEEEKRRIASQKKAAQATSTNQLSTDRPSVNTDRPFVSSDRSFVSTDRSNTPTVSTASTSTGANVNGSSFVYLGGKIPIDASTLPNVDLPIDLNMPVLEDASDTLPNDIIFNGAYDDDEDVGVEADFNNMDNTIAVSPILTLRIHKDHPKGQILGDPTSAVQTRGKIQKASSHNKLGKDTFTRQNRTNNKEHKNYLFHVISTQEEPKTISQALRDKVIGTKWVFRNKRDERSIVVKNKARLVAQGFRQEEGIDYDVFLHLVARIKAIKVIFSFASKPVGYLLSTKWMLKVHFSMALLKKRSPEAWYEDTFSFLMENGFRRGLQVKQQSNGIFISQDKYVADILKKFDFLSIRTATTPIESNKPLVKDEDGVDVDVHVYRSMIGSLMYLTASRPDIMFAVCACARFQVTPKVSHLNAVKIIFRYLKHQPKLGLWYPRDSPFELEAYSDSDYGGASLDRKSTTGGCQFLGRRLISWQCKKQTIVANSTTEAEYVAATNCCGQVLWIQNQMIDYGFNFMNTKIYIDNESTISVIKNPVAHSRTKQLRFHSYY
ncbi:putative ribonuclease H-like domain-containing protein [Tanacetum coccineum]